jgi:hypothetical protein
VNDVKWVNPHQPQTLYIGVILCYINAVFGLLSLQVVTVLGLFIVVGLAAGGFGIANEKKWGYTVAVAAAVTQVLLYIVFGGLSALNNFSVFISFMFDAALVALLLHPQSRDYQRIWFR